MAHGKLWMGNTPPLSKSKVTLWAKPNDDTTQPYTFMYFKDDGIKREWTPIPKGADEGQIIALQDRLTIIENELDGISAILDKINGEVI